MLNPARWCRAVVLSLVAATTATTFASAATVTTFSLANGMQVVVIPDHRVPVVTHMVWYRVGAADDPPGRTGLAHFLEHLMFKETAKIKSGEFTRIVTGLGGRHNALTAHDTTAYFQRVAKEHLRRVMELEAERMGGLRLKADEVRTEREVIREERRSSVDAAPIAMLNEQMLAQLYQNHPYGRPVLGWTHEMTALTLEDAREFYLRHYAPNNAVLVVAGDVTTEEVRALAEATYGRNKANPAIKARARPREPEAIAARSLRLEDPRAPRSPLVLRYYLMPSTATAKPGDAEALALLGRIIGGDDTSRLYRTLVLDRKLAVQSGADYQGGGLDGGRLSLLALGGAGATAAALEAALDEVVAGVVASGVTEAELARAKRAIEADWIFENDNQEKLARRYGEAATLGRPVGDVLASQARTEAVSLADVKRVAAEHLDIKRSVTGVLVQPRTAPAGGVAAATKP